MKVKVIKHFVDKETKKLYVRHGYYQSDNDERIAELQEKGFLESPQQAGSFSAPSDVDDLKSLGGGVYELPNGDKIRGKAKALEALESLSVDNGEGSGDDEPSGEGGDDNGTESGDNTDGGTVESGDGQESSESGSK